MRLLRRAAFWLLVAAILLFALFPFYYAVVTSLRPASALFEPAWLPHDVTLANYEAVFGEQPFGRNILNSIAVAASVVGLAMLAGVTAAYSLARIRFRGRGALLGAILAVSMFPQVAMLSGMFELIRALGLYNHLAALTLSYMVFTLPFTVWILTTFLRELPKELEEAALIDGANAWQTLTRVFLPLMGPSLATTGLLAFVAAWNEFLFALTFTLTDEKRTVPVAVALMSGASQYELPWANIMAASVTVTLPLIALALIFQNRIVAGLTAGAIKG
ncbi:MAG TPA: carbohydrate ABC transporter permease [Burkholderiales bacterium]|nr:carbohydrate ABC transporter permease [Burkholderiales bacterium]